MKKIKELRAKIADIKMRANKIVGKTPADRTEEEKKALLTFSAELTELEAELDLAIQFHAVESDPQAAADPKMPAFAPLAEPKKSGFANFGEFMNAVRNAKINNSVDPRLISAAAAGANQGVDEEGGYLVTKEFMADLTKTIYEESTLYGATMQIPIGGNFNGITLRMPQEGFGEDPKGTGGVTMFGGAIAYWINEAEKIDMSKLRFEVTELKLKKIAALMFATGEMMQDVPALNAFTTQSAGVVIAYAIDEGLLNGNFDGLTNKSQPTGILKAPSLITVTPKSTSSIISVEDILAMWSKMRERNRKNAEWYINQDIEQHLMTLKIGDNPVYLPAGGLSGAPYATILGRPVRSIDQASELGSVGDIIFADMSQYVTINKGGIRSDMSIHVMFDTDQTAFRFIVRMDGTPLRKNKFKRAKGGEFSPFVTLGARTLA